MSFLSKLFRSNDQLPADETPPAPADDRPSVIAEPPVSADAEEQPGEVAEDNAVAPQPDAQEGQDEPAWWEELAPDSPPSAVVTRSSNGGTAPLEQEPADHAPDTISPSETDVAPNTAAAPDPE